MNDGKNTYNMRSVSLGHGRVMRKYMCEQRFMFLIDAVKNFISPLPPLFWL